MRCCIQNCLNDDSKKTNKSQGLTFHRLPRAPDHSAAWIQAITTLGCRMNKCLVVCSEHFLPEDFDDTRHNQRRVKSGAVPTIKPPVVQEDFKMCRVCLSLDVKIYHMKDYKLNEMFQNITGILIDMENKGSILQRICLECAARLKAAAAFREKALLSDALLKDLELINKSDITTFQENHTSLRSNLTVHTAFTCDIESKNNNSENKKVNIFLPNQPDVKESTEIGVSQDEKETEEPWIYAPIKIESEFDPIAENDDDQDRKLFADSLTIPKENSEAEISNRKVEINDEVNNLRENANNVSIINSDENIILANDKVQKYSDSVTVITEEEFSSAEDSQSATEDCVDKSKNNKVGVVNEKGTMRNYKINDRLKEKIVSMKKNGCPVSAIAKETGLTISSIICWWRRYRKNGCTFRRTIAPRKNQSDTQKHQYEVKPGKELGPCSEIVRQRLYEAGFEHILMKKPGDMENEGKKTSERRAHHDDLRRRIIALKQEGVAIRKIAHLLNTTRDTVRKWWDRWCNEGHMLNHKHLGRKRKTTKQEDELILQRVMQEQSVHTPSLAMEFGLSPESVRKRLKEAGFKRKIREPYAPLKAGRSQKVDEELKQQILSMKSKGVSVTDIANQFRVPRTTIYQWWQRWCKENNIKVTSDNHMSTTTEEQGSTKHAHVEKSLQGPAIISSQKSLWQKLPEEITKLE